MIEWHLERRRIKDLKPYPKNPRYMSKDQARYLQRNLEKYGLIDKPSINLDNTLIGGHQRIKILKKMGEKEIDVFVPSYELTKEEVKELNLTLNRLHGDFDYDILANEYDMEDLFESGFTDRELSMVSEAREEILEKKNKKLKKCPSCGYES